MYVYTVLAIQILSLLGLLLTVTINTILGKEEKALKKIISEKTKGFPWLADALSKYYSIKEMELADYLEGKKHPAKKAAEEVRNISKEKRLLKKESVILRNYVAYYESLFPWLREYVSDDIDDLVNDIYQEKEQDSQEDPVKRYMTPAEYKKLSPSKRNQKALDRYWSKKKSKWEIGRDYERYIGYLYEQKGYSVCYHGIKERFEDLGRDLIAKKDNEIVVIQCKYWASHKQIHENHVTQLLGTTLKLWLENSKSKSMSYVGKFQEYIKSNQIRGILVTSTNLSDTAREFAKELDIIVDEEFPFKPYPSIKCNISKSTGEKIYHLPIDQQYDTIVIEKDKGESYVNTVKEAEELGFRRAYRWSGNSN
jgi:hypothetical protein